MFLYYIPDVNVGDNEKAHERYLCAYHFYIRLYVCRASVENENFILLNLGQFNPIPIHAI